MRRSRIESRTICNCLYDIISIGKVFKTSGDLLRPPLGRREDGNFQSGSICHGSQCPHRRRYLAVSFRLSYFSLSRRRYLALVFFHVPLHGRFDVQKLCAGAAVRLVGDHLIQAEYGLIVNDSERRVKWISTRLNLPFSLTLSFFLFLLKDIAVAIVR